MLTHTTSIIAHTQLAPSIWSIRLACPGGFQFAPGQYILVHIDHTDLSTKAPYPRAYSIAEYTGEPAENGQILASEISIIYKQYAGGVATSFLKSKQVGDPLTIQGPAGHYTLPRHLSTEAKEVNFVVTGTGIAPIMCMVRSLLIVHCPFLIIHLFWGLPTIRDVYLQKEFKALKKEFARRSIDITISLCLSREQMGVLPSVDQCEVFGSRIQSVLDKKIDTAQHNRSIPVTCEPGQSSGTCQLTGSVLGPIHGSRNEPHSGPFGVREVNTLSLDFPDKRSAIREPCVPADLESSQLPRSSSELFSLCGSGVFVEEMRAHLIARGVGPKQMVFERFS